MLLKGARRSVHPHICTNIGSGSKKIVATHLKTFEKDLKDHNLEPGTVTSIISKAKAKRLSADGYLDDAKSKAHYRGPTGTESPPTPDIIVGEVYVLYEATLRQNNALDFDDLLVFGVKLFSGHHLTVDWCRHILVDELCARIACVLDNT
jgi:DNA helicase-2/ATP-dependent DNA helicase PcrA